MCLLTLSLLIGCVGETYTFGGVRPYVCLSVLSHFEQFYTTYWHGAGDNRNSALPSSAQKMHETQIYTHLPLSVQVLCVYVCNQLLFRQVAPSQSIMLLIKKKKTKKDNQYKLTKPLA